MYKRQGVRTIGDEQLRNVTPNAFSKDCFYLVDAVGVTEHAQTVAPIDVLGQKPQKVLKSLWMTVWRTIMNFIRNSRMLQLVILLMMCISIRALTCR